MLAICIKKLFLSLVALFSLTPVVAQAEASSTVPNKGPEVEMRERWDDEDGCNAKLKMSKLFAKKIRALCIDAGKVNAHNVCADIVATKDIQAENAQINSMSVNDLCITGTVKANFIENCGLYRATVVYSAPTDYTLGTPLEFDTVLDDPNGNITVSPGMTTYTAPVSGYYIVTLEVDLSGFDIPSNPVLGTPVANPQVVVNGLPFRETFTPLLAFHNGQHSLVTALISLSAGDVVSSSYTLLALTDAGFTTLAGSATISGNGTEGAQSLLKIHYLSSDCNPAPCTPFPPVNVDCGHCPDVGCCN